MFRSNKCSLKLRKVATGMITDVALILNPRSTQMLIMTDHVPDPFIIAKSRQLNKRVTLNVGGVRHEVRQSHQPTMTVIKS